MGDRLGTGKYFPVQEEVVTQSTVLWKLRYKQHDCPSRNDIFHTEIQGAAYIQ